MPTTANILADQLEITRDLTRWYLSKLKETDPYHQFVVDGKPLNNWYWVVAHLAWAQHFLIINGTGGTPMPGFEDLAQFSMGNSFNQSSAKWDVKQLITLLKEVHQQSISHLRTLTDEQLKEDNKLGFSFTNDMSQKAIIMHCIRHEGTHTGHLSLLCKLFEVKTI